MRSTLLAALLLVLVAPRAHASPQVEGAAAHTRQPTAAAQRVMAKVEAACDDGNVKAFLALATGKLTIDGKAVARSTFSADVASAGGLETYLGLGGNEWRIGVRDDGGWSVSRGEPTTAAVIVVAKVKGSWKVRAIETAAGMTDTVGVNVGSHHADDTAAAPLSKISFGAASVKGKLGKSAIKKKLTAHARDLQDCYESELAHDAKLAGTVSLVFTIGTDGKVTASSGTGMDSDVANCVAGVIDTIEFGKAKKSTRVKWAITFARP